MNSPELNAPVIRQFLHAVDAYGRTIRDCGTDSRGEFLHRVEVALARLYLSATELPEVIPDSSDVPDSRSAREEYRVLQGSMASVLGRFDGYRSIFDQSDSEDSEPVYYLLSLDLIEILEDVEEARSLLDSKIPLADVLWQWRFDFTSHWGRHAVSALTVVNGLLYTHFVGALDNDKRPDA